METAQRSPKGIPYKDNSKTTGVDYKTPPNAPLEEPEQVLSILNDLGQEVPDSVPMEPPLGFLERPSLADFVRRMIHGEISKAAEEMELESFEEADDLEVEDDPIDPLTPYEEVFMPRPTPVATPAQQPAAEGGGAGEGTVSPPEPAPAPAPPPNGTAS